MDVGDLLPCPCCKHGFRLMVDLHEGAKMAVRLRHDTVSYPCNVSAYFETVQQALEFWVKHTQEMVSR